MRVGVFHPGTQHSWQTALAFQQVGMLAWYASSVFYDPKRWPYKLERCVPGSLSAQLGREFRRRHSPLLDPKNVRQFGWWEWSEVLMRRLGQQTMSDACNRLGNRAFCRQVIRLIEREPVDLLWGFNSSCLEVFQWAKKRGIQCILDQTIGHPAAQNQVMLREQECHPEFFVDSYRPLDAPWIGRQNQEAAEADLVVVGSDFCARTMSENGCAKEKILVVHYGYDESLFPAHQPQRNASRTRRRPVRFLFAGEIGPRKGIAYLLKAFAEIPTEKAKLTLVGRLAIPSETFQKYTHRIDYVAQVPRSEIPGYFAEADCFVFPSLFEGSAIVLYEARGAGLGIIQTDRCGDGVMSGQNGYVLREISVEELTKAVERVAGDPGLCADWQAASWAGRGERTWADYRGRIVKLARALQPRTDTALQPVT
jgi:glycosyltransferase involved in cell wall biosynthesis